MKSSSGGLVEIPPGHMWIEGDNADVSVDSRGYGPVPVGLLRGKVIMRLVPFAPELNGTASKSS